MLKESNFIKTIIAKDIKKKKYNKIITRFPPEPNGFLHLGHARAIIINFELAKYFNGITYLRYDDTNPYKEKKIFIEAIEKDIKWLNYKPNKIFFTSDYFEEIFQKAVILIKKNKAFVDDLTEKEIKEYRGTLNKPGINSPFRERSIKENLDLFYKMKTGFFKKKEKVLRAKIDMSNPNINLRDPVIYRILDNYTLKKQHHFIFPSYDFSHPLADSIEKISHSLCSLEFEDHRPLYEWFLKETEMKHIPKQIEFGRLNITNTCLSKRSLNFLVENKLVEGWDDPRMPTLIGMKNKGLPPEAIKKFILNTGLSKNNSFVDIEMLNSEIRKILQKTTKKTISIINPLKVTIINYPENQTETRNIEYNENCNPNEKREILFSKHIYIEKNDFELIKKDEKSKKLRINEEVRLLYFYFIKVVDVIYDKKGEIEKLLATYDIKTKSGSGFNERKPNGTIHFLSQKNTQKAIFNFFQPIFNNANPKDFTKEFNNNSWQKKEVLIEKGLSLNIKNEKFQFIRKGFFHLTNQKSKIPNFNEIVPLKKLY
ncbi:glutamine--tRNA ligase [Texas Phoenix palm phytoplasma]|uniref:Glutamine--tRNA ligase n=1 Tax=Texas Phoenix palm phytoplasma TaxID=176709 RepID=A0ABS5BJW4_9MOLU|nr:glutamine--tRNA ligase [Texas Phoenix palm phytoplasma]MBP3059479.1 glutamine--tRNA ligase [Texas Phoenix palm phytoplasma]